MIPRVGEIKRVRSRRNDPGFGWDRPGTNDEDGRRSGRKRAVEPGNHRNADSGSFGDRRGLGHPLPGIFERLQRFSLQCFLIRGAHGSRCGAARRRGSATDRRHERQGYQCRQDRPAKSSHHSPFLDKIAGEFGGGWRVSANACWVLPMRVGQAPPGCRNCPFSSSLFVAYPYDSLSGNRCR
jgi:hypothetical protein